MTSLLPVWVDSAAKDIGVLAAIVVGLGVLFTKTPLGRVIRYVYRHLFGEPVSNWLRRVIKDVVDPLMNAMSARNSQEHAETGQRLDGIERRMATVEAQAEVTATRLTNGSARMDSILTELGGLRSEVAALRTNKEAAHASDQ